MTDPALTDEEKHLNQIRAIGTLFRGLPSDRARIDVIVAMTTTMKNQLAKNSKADGLLTEWMEQACGTLEAIRMLWKD